MSRSLQKSRLSALSLAFALAGLAAPAVVCAQSASQPTAGRGSTAVPAADRAFAQKAAAGGAAEVEMGKLAQQKAASDDVKAYGARMVADHTKSGDELKQIASSKALTLPAGPDAKHKGKLAKLEKLSGAAFDRAYMDEMVADHRHTVADFQKEANSGRDADLKGFAAKTLPTLQDHLKMAQATNSAVKGGKPSAPAASASR